MINVTRETLESLLAWSEPTIVTNVRGQRSLRTAVPSMKFWGVWRSQRDAVKALGIDVRPEPSGEWICKWWNDVPATPSVPSTPSVPVVVKNPNAKPIERVAANGRSWSDEQMAIFEWFRDGNGSLVVRARAGTGKTTTIKQAFTYAPEARMLYAVFNKKNQIEAQSAIRDPRVEIKTLHALGFMFIQAVWPKVKPTDEVEEERVKRACGFGSLQAGENVPSEVRTAVKKLVGFAKNMIVHPNVPALIDLANDRGLDCEQFESEANGGWTVTKLAECAMMALEYSAMRDPEGRISFNDMVWLPVHKGWVRQWFDMVVVDEAQDMNVPQLLMAKGSVKKGGRVCVVGDDRQAIYGFRGACSDGMNMMKIELSAKELGLTITYRCPKNVVALAQPIVPDYRAAGAAPEGTIEHISDAKLHEKVVVGDAILSRANAPLMPVCLNLLRKGIPARIEGRDIGRMLLGIVERLNARTVPQFLTKVETWSNKQKNRFRNTRNFEAKAQEIDDQAATLVAVAEGASSVGEIKERIKNLFQDSENSRTPAVILSSVHKAKGLEWNKVLLLTWTFNKKAPGADTPSLEEQNIYYVGLTRSKDTLVMVHDSKSPEDRD